LPETNHKFCSDLCSWSHHAHLAFLKQAREDQVVSAVIQASATPAQPISLRTVMRMIARAETLEAGPQWH